MSATIATSKPPAADTKGEKYVWSEDQKIELSTYEQMVQMLTDLGFKVKLTRLWVKEKGEQVAYISLEG